MSERISDAEHAVMEVLWDEAPLAAADVAERIDPARGIQDAQRLVVVVTPEGVRARQQPPTVLQGQQR